ncbi:hypothetical protein PR202_gb20407 [Eleusine coracana subsp. coracana]|uniref:Uncharacterized protein n=1 Tax=Eleusine coracana subsp. coracana TaxID=191504 RepID=A0AAV5F8G9_ELECO|nr:hypothetical protein PR202_gb20407 [Eleusine coracana subsp. coracana]
MSHAAMDLSVLQRASVHARTCLCCTCCPTPEHRCVLYLYPMPVTNHTSDRVPSLASQLAGLLVAHRKEWHNEAEAEEGPSQQPAGRGPPSKLADMS